MTWICLNCEASEKGTGVVRSKTTLSLCTYCVASLQRSGRAWCRRGKHVVASVGKHPRWCATCRSEANRAYREANHERALERVKEWKKAHPGRPRKRAYTKWTPEQLAQRREWYAATREVRNEIARSYRKAQAAASPGYWKERRQRAKVNMFRRLFG